MTLDPALVRSEGMSDFRAVLDAHGLYNTEQFVLRLSPRNHELIDSITSKNFDRNKVSGETLQAYSTYIHETIHWWQHIGSTTGLLLSTCFPNQTHMNLSDMTEWCNITKPFKSIKNWALNGELSGKDHTDAAQALANTIINNYMDVQFFKLWLLKPEISTDIYQDKYFESQGHCFNIAYSGLISNIQPIIDPNSVFLPSLDRWEQEFRQLTELGQIGYYYGSPIFRRHTSLAQLWEGQACFNQMQFLNSATPDLTLDDFREAGMLYGVYEAAFIKFLELSGLEMPACPLDPRVALFLLVVDLAINPTEGFPCDISNFASFVNLADPNIRFELLCRGIADDPTAFSNAIKDYSKSEYLDVSWKLTSKCGIQHISEGWDEVQKWRLTIPEVGTLMKEKDLFQYQNSNMALRVLLSFFIDFTTDKSSNPEFFCWPGYWKANSSEHIEDLWLNNLSLFSDKADDGGIFIRKFPNKTEEDLTKTLNNFFGNGVVYNLSRQWIFNDGPFKFNFKWLSERHEEDEWKSWAERQFKALYGVAISEISY
ncbi:hypothetical protein CO671_01865 [Rhizobium sp. M10]|uniref:hypothetical protein n=1 Tax=Rhizobium sp. M10 TaxID=1324586 RepID=UPI000BEA72C9|nr:hypothetical protein [Rhizobium sp. M10]PDT38168.1 hypothetical protein CO671_01865 [Rhizobium sp. M10]